MIAGGLKRGLCCATLILLCAACQDHATSAILTTKWNACEIEIPRSIDERKLDDPARVIAAVKCGSKATSYPITLLNLNDEEFDTAYSRYIKCTSPDLSVQALRKMFPITLLGRLENVQKCNVPLRILEQLRALRTPQFHPRETSYAANDWSEPTTEIVEMTTSEHERGVRSGAYWGFQRTSADPKAPDLICVHHENGFRGTATDEVIFRSPSQSAADCLRDYLDEVAK